CGDVRHFAAHAAADARVVDVRDRIRAQRIGVLLHSERWTTGQADAGMIARAGIRVDAEALGHHAVTRLNRLAPQRRDAPLAIQLALPLRYDHLRAAKVGTQGLVQHFERLAHVIGVRASDPADTDTFDCIDNRVVALAMNVHRT